MTHNDLVEIAYRWVLNEAGCAFAFRDFVSEDLSSRYPDIIGAGSFSKSVAVKVEISRDEYLRKLSNAEWLSPEMNMGRFRFFCVPTNLVKEDDLPANWGLIYINEKGIASCVVNPYGSGSTHFWKNGFDDEVLYNLLTEDEKLNAACRRFLYRAIIHLK